MGLLKEFSREKIHTFCNRLYNGTTEVDQPQPQEHASTREGLKEFYANMELFASENLDPDPPCEVIVRRFA